MAGHLTEDIGVVVTHTVPHFQFHWPSRHSRSTMPVAKKRETKRLMKLFKEMSLVGNRVGAQTGIDLRQPQCPAI